ncbi:protein translocase subunit SecF [Mycolicibacterium thermoresistibile]
MAAKHSVDTDDQNLDGTTAVEAPGIEASSAPKRGIFVRLYTGTGAFEVVGKRKLWYAVSAVILLVAVASIVLRGFTLGIDFEGGTRVSLPATGADGPIPVEEVEAVFTETVGSPPDSVVVVGSGATATVQARSETLTDEQTESLRSALFDAFAPLGADGEPSRLAISDSAVSETWGDQITEKALIALVVFVVLAAIYITVRYERYMALAALAAMFFDIIVTAGVYSLVGWEVTPAMVIGLMTILGFSIYDTVIVFDKVEENTHGFEHTTRRTYAEHANLAVNQTFMRSINTSVITVLPILALMIIAVWMLGVGTLKDLALVQLVGIVVGTYSSIYFATPLLVTLRERFDDKVAKHTRRVMNRRNRPAAPDTSGSEDDPGTPDDTEPDAAATTVSVPAADKPAPGARPVRPSASRTGRPAGKRKTRRQ